MMRERYDPCRKICFEITHFTNLLKIFSWITRIVKTAWLSPNLMVQRLYTISPYIFHGSSYHKQSLKFAINSSTFTLRYHLLISAEALVAYNENSSK